MEQIRKDIKYLFEILSVCATGKYNLGVSEKPIQEYGENYIHTMCTGIGIFTRQYEYKGYTLNYNHLSLADHKIMNIDKIYSEEETEKVILKRLMDTVCRNYTFKQLLNHDMVLMQDDKIVKRFTRNVFCDVVNYLRKHKYVTRFDSDASSYHVLGNLTVTFPQEVTSVNVYGKRLPFSNGKTTLKYDINNFMQEVMNELFFEPKFDKIYSLMSDKIEYDRLMTLYELE